MTDSFARHRARLLAAAAPTVEPADAAALAGTLALALSEAETTGGLPADGLGLAPDDLGRLIDRVFPTFPRADFRLDRHDLAPLDDEEAMLRDLLLAHRRDDDPLGSAFAALIARRALRPDHLWQDLGLTHRGELNALLARHFPALHAGNTGNMRWKKYFYRRICEAEGFTLCTAPSCALCCDFADCFGEEAGLSRLAHVRRELGGLDVSGAA